MSYALLLVEKCYRLLIVGGCTENPIEISADMIGKIAIEEIEAAPAVEAIHPIPHAILGDHRNLLLINTMNDLEDFRF